MGLIWRDACDILGEVRCVGRPDFGKKVGIEKLPWEERQAEQPKTARPALIFDSMSSLQHERVEYYAAMDYEEQMVIVASLDKSDEEQMIGVGRYVREKNSDLAELALVVHDDWQGRGVGTLTREYLQHIARSHNIGGFKAEVLERNKRALHVFTRVAKRAKTEYDEGVYTASYRFAGA